MTRSTQAIRNVDPPVQFIAVTVWVVYNNRLPGEIEIKLDLLLHLFHLLPKLTDPLLAELKSDKNVFEFIILQLSKIANVEFILYFYSWKILFADF